MQLAATLNWFCIYLATGVAAILITRLVVFIIMRKRDRPSEGLRNIFKAMRDTRQQPIKWKDLAEQYLLFVPLIFLLWPLAFGMVLKDRFYPTVWKPDPEDAFACHRKHLVRVVSPDAAEAEAKVVDPLGRVPDLPFGHLNAGWRALLANRQLGDLLWYFEIPGYTPGPEAPPQRHHWSVPQGAKRGYALARSGKVRAEFVFEWD